MFTRGIMLHNNIHPHVDDFHMFCPSRRELKHSRFGLDQDIKVAADAVENQGIPHR
jgi:hypothetical protein